MRRLLLWRHAKAERSQPGERDVERVLAEGGRGDAATIAAYMVRHALTPDLVLVSTSERTRETWAEGVKAFDRPPRAIFDDRLYEAPAQNVLKVVRETPPEVGTLLIVGHNPGLQELAVQLVAAGDVDARQRLKEDFPTAALAVISFALEDWSQLHPHSGRLEHFVTPRFLAAATD
jgi:phosphohistidine phosphatase